MAPLLVTAAIICRDDKVLIAQRRGDSELEAFKWEFPGGKVEWMEAPEDCLQREILEELNIHIRVGRVFKVQSHVYPRPEKPLHIILICYQCEYISGEIQNLAVQDSKWIRADEFANYEFAAADIPVVNDLVIELNNCGRIK